MNRGVVVSEVAVVIADDPDVREQVGAVLARIGFEVVNVSGGYDGIVAVGRHRPRLTVIDSNIADVDSVTATLQIRAVSPTLIAVVSGESEEVSVVAGLSAGADAYITAPFSPRVFRARVSALLRRTSATRPLVPLTPETASLSSKHQTPAVRGSRPPSPIRRRNPGAADPSTLVPGRRIVGPGATPPRPAPAAPEPVVSESVVPEPVVPAPVVSEPVVPAPVAEPKPAAPKVAEPKPAAPKPAAPKPAAPKVAEPKPAAPKVAEPKPAAPKVAEPKPAAPKVAEPKPAAPKAVEPKPAAPKAAEPKPAAPKAAEPKPAEPKAAEPKPAEPEPAEPELAEPKPEVPRPPADLIETRGLVINPRDGWVKVDDRTVDLTDDELQILVVLMSGARRVLSRSMLAQILFGIAETPTDDDRRAIDAVVASLCKQLGEDPSLPRWIGSVPGIGYRRTAR